MKTTRPNHDELPPLSPAQPDAVGTAAWPLGVLLEAQRDLAAVEGGPPELMDLAAQRARVLTHADDAAVDLAAHADALLGPARATPAASQGPREGRHYGLMEQCVRGGLPLRCADAETDPRVDRAACLRDGVRSVAVAPIACRRRVVGALSVVAEAPDAFSDADTQALHVLAGMLGAALGTASKVDAEKARGVAERAASQAVLQESEVTERKQVQVGMLRADRVTSMGILAAGVAHEINNPLAYVMANLTFVSDEVARVVQEARADAGGEAMTVGALVGRLEETLQALDEARKGAERVRTIVRDLKTLSRVDDDHRGLVDVRRVLESSVNMSWNEIRHRARLVKDYGETPTVEANEAHLGQVFLNLLINAAQAIPEGHSDAHEIRITTRTDASGAAVIDVRDSGQGIPAEIRGRLFEPFFTTKPQGVGTGIGLSICQNIVTGLGGQITVESQEGQGSVFRIVLPAARVGPTPSEVPAPPPGQASRGRLLIVDDDPLVCAAIRRSLRRDHDVVAVTSAREALDLLTAGEPAYDVVLCDLMMPGMSGMAMYAELARLAPEQTSKIIFLTGGVFTALAQSFLESVANLRLEKPVDLHLLRALIAERLRTAS